LTLRLISLHKLNNNLNFAPFSRKFKRIRLQVHEHLLDPFLIGFNEQVLVLKRNVLHTFVLAGQSFFGLETYELAKHLYVPPLSLVLLNRSDVFNRSLDIEGFNVLGELSSLQLGVT
jgi:hypothetical protein